MAISMSYLISGLRVTFTAGTYTCDGVTIHPDDCSSINKDVAEALNEALVLYPDFKAAYYVMERLSMIHERYDRNWDGEFSKDGIPLLTFPERDIPRKYRKMCEGFQSKLRAEYEQDYAYCLSRIQAEEAQKKIKRTPIKNQGYVYLLQSPTSAYKIGRTKDPKKRGKTFGVQLPFEVEFLALIKTDNMEDLEHELHLKFANKTINGEWFALSDEDVQYIKGLAEVSNG